MVGAKLHYDTGDYPGSGRGPYVQQGWTRGAVLLGTVVLAEGSYK
jgi:hypothetical protein